MVDATEKKDEMQKGAHTLPPPADASPVAAMPAESRPAAAAHGKDAPVAALPTASPIPSPETNGKPKRVEGTFGEKVVNTFNNYGLNWFANSALSLFITYNVMPTKFGDKMKTGAGKVTTPLVMGYHKLKSRITKKALDVNADHIEASKRSAAEILCMAISGCIILPFMKHVDDHKREYVEWMNDIKVKWFGGKPSNGNGTNGTKDGVPPGEFQEEKQGWGKLLFSRAMALIAVLVGDQIVQNRNNSKPDSPLNTDKASWKLGGWLYEKLPTKFTNWVVDFVGRKGKGDIQKEVRPHIDATLKGAINNKKVFAEQARLVQKDVGWTLALAMMMHAMSKINFVSFFRDLFGMKDKDIPPELQLPAPEKKEEPSTYPAEEAPPAGKFVHKVPSKATVPSTLAERQAGSFQETLARQAEAAGPQLSQAT